MTLSPASHKRSVPHSCAFFPAQEWETSTHAAPIFEKAAQ
jgi:hypothetical protein